MKRRVLEIGWQSHFGVVRPMEDQVFYRGE
jgi:hypothetical protein